MQICALRVIPLWILNHVNQVVDLFTDFIDTLNVVQLHRDVLRFLYIEFVVFIKGFVVKLRLSFKLNLTFLKTMVKIRKAAPRYISLLTSSKNF